jgi:hypothetical protein
LGKEKHTHKNQLMKQENNLTQEESQKELHTWAVGSLGGSTARD